MSTYLAHRPGTVEARDPFAMLNIPTFLRGDQRALCAEHDPELWFDKDNEEARRICHRCPLQPGCGQWGFERREWGVWAGVGSGGHRLGTKHQLRRADEARRQQALQLVASGLPATVVARQVALSVNTVQRYMREAAA